MITAIDTNVLLDYLNPAEAHNEQSTQWLMQAGEEGALVISQATYAELAASFESLNDFTGFLTVVGIEVLPFTEAALFLAGKAWLQYAQRRPLQLQCAQCGSFQAVTCERCGNSIRARQHILADFLIGAHAQVHADQLLTRDRSYYETYFPELRLA